MKRYTIITLILVGLFVVQTVGATVALVDAPLTPTVSLKLGSRGDSVRALQLQLSKIPGVYPEGWWWVLLAQKQESF
ncbi:MAG: hypothetical protein AB198_02025 [Parcubacteria bacterium C7867-003]|nr:MAG: hypothetical protein AB198_02025 [Parcubacteria bacterium C7867-003]